MPAAPQPVCLAAPPPPPRPGLALARSTHYACAAMPPGRKPKAAAARPVPAAGAEAGAPAAGAVAAAAPAAAPRRQGFDNSANTALFARLTADLQMIRSSPIFAGVEQAAPQEIGKARDRIRASSTPSRRRSTKRPWRVRKSIRPTSAFFAQSLLFSPAPGVPQPAPCPFDHRCYRRLQPRQRLGAWQSVAPEEMKHTFLRAVARGIDAAAETCVLERWRHTALNCTAELKNIDGRWRLLRGA